MAGVSEDLDEIFGGDINSDERGSTGITLEGIRNLASRLRMGEKFSSFEEFDLAVDCWSFEHGRPCHRLKTQKNFRLRVCREGSRMVTRKSTIDYSERLAEITRGGDEPFRNFEAFTQGSHVPTGPYDRRGIRMARNGRCGERLRYLTAGSIVHRSGSEVNHVSQPLVLPSRCKWRIKARRDDIDGVVVTVCQLEHTCSSSVTKWRGHASGSKFLATVMRGKMSVDLNARIRVLHEDMRVSYGETVQYHQLWRARERCREDLNCSNAVSFELIPQLLAKMREVDPACIVDWGSFDGTDIFSRAFICPGASRHMLQHCQKVIALDACHSKNRKFPCQIFLASALDGNKEAIILCFAVAHTEDTDTWTWFCQLMRDSLVGLDKEITVLISDQQKGLANAVEEVFDGFVHGTCAHHLLMNLQSRFGKAMASNFNGILYVKSPERFEGLLRSLEQFGDKGMEMADYLREADPWRWARCLFPLARYGRTTSNLVESLNAALLPVRFGTAFKIIVDIWYYMQQSITTRRDKLRHFTGRLTPYASRRFQQNERQSRAMVCLLSDSTQASVGTHRGRASFVVKRLEAGKGTCGCAEYQEMGWPCSHGIAFERELGYSIEERFDSIWFLESLGTLYDLNSIPALDLAELTPDARCIAPPEVVRRGRHRIVRIPNTSRNGRGDFEADFEADLTGTEPHAFDLNYTGDSTMEFEFDMFERPLVLVRNDQDPALMEGASQGTSYSQPRIRRGNPSNTVRCGLCSQMGHNRRTCSNGGPSHS